MNWAFVENAITGAIGRRFITAGFEPVVGGCINQCFTLTSGMGDRFFVKLNEPSTVGAFERERQALEEIGETRTVRVPRPVAHGTNTHYAFLVLEYLPLTSLEEESLATLGRQLAQLHHHTANAFGWHANNAIGATLQLNEWMPDWVDFWRERRLLPQLRWAEEAGLRLANTDELLQRLPQFIGHHPAASLVHGDLWAGNAAALASGEPVILDPAAYYGDREVDLAFTVMFGGFGEAFYQAYESEYPLPHGADLRLRFYNFYHELNHFNLFRGGYGEQATNTLNWLLAQVR